MWNIKNESQVGFLQIGDFKVIHLLIGAWLNLNLDILSKLKRIDF